MSISLAKVLKCMGNDDSVTVRYDSGSSLLRFTMEREKDDRVAKFELKLLNLDSDGYGITVIYC